MRKLLALFLVVAFAGCAAKETEDVTPAESTGEAVAMEETFVPAGEMVALSAKGDVTGYASLPLEPDPAKPALILIHEWWGLDDWIKENKPKPK